MQKWAFTRGKSSLFFLNNLPKSENRWTFSALCLLFLKVEIVIISFQRGDSPPEQISQRRVRMPVVAFPWQSLNTFPIEEPDSRRSSNCPAPPLIGQRNWHANAHELETSLLCNAGKHHDKYKQKIARSLQSIKNLHAATLGNYSQTNRIHLSSNKFMVI